MNTGRFDTRHVLFQYCLVYAMRCRYAYQLQASRIHAHPCFAAHSLQDHCLHSLQHHTECVPCCADVCGALFDSGHDNLVIVTWAAREASCRLHVPPEDERHKPFSLPCPSPPSFLVMCVICGARAARAHSVTSAFIWNFDFHTHMEFQIL